MLDQTLKPEQIEELETQGKLIPEEVKVTLEEAKAIAKEAVKDPLGSTKSFGTRKFLKEAASYWNQPNFFMQRAVIAQLGIYGNSGEEAVYIGYFYDKDGKPFNSADHNFIMRFEGCMLPPVNAFWSLSMYDGKTQLFIHNPLNRYLLNSTMKDQFVKEEDGSIVLYIQKDSPGKDKEPNWLPAPDGPFYLVLRLYSPQPEILEGKWKSPSLDEIVAVSVTAQTVQTRIGELEFTHDFENGYPTDETVKKLYDEIDFQRACQAYLWGLPLVSIAEWQHAHEEIFGAGDGDFVIYTTYRDVQGILTANVTTPYVFAFANLKRTGPLVLELQPGPNASGAGNFWQRAIVDIGAMGQDQNKGGKYLILPPDSEMPDV